MAHTRNKVVDESGQNQPQDQFGNETAQALLQGIETLFAFKRCTQAPDQERHTDENGNPGDPVRNGRKGRQRKLNGSNIQVYRSLTLHGINQFTKAPDGALKEAVTGRTSG